MSNKEVFKRFGEGFSNNLDSLLASGPKKVVKKEPKIDQEEVVNIQEKEDKINEEGSVLESVVANRPKPVNRRRPTNIRGVSSSKAAEEDKTEENNEEEILEEEKKINEEQAEQSIFSKLFWNTCNLVFFPITLPLMLYRKYSN